MTTHKAHLLLLLSCLASGCVEWPPPNTDLSSPKSAAQVYLKALQRADARTAGSVSTGTFEQMRWIDDLVILVSGMRQYNNALYTKFGRITLQEHTQLEESIRVLVDEPLALLPDASVYNDGHQARLDLPTRGFTARSQPAIWLSLDGKQWKVDLGKTYVGDGTKEQIHDVSQALYRCRRAGEALKYAATDLVYGPIHTLPEAQKALQERLDALKDE